MLNTARDLEFNDHLNTSFDRMQKEEKLRKIIEQELSSRNEYSHGKVEWKNGGAATLSDVSGLSLTRVLLRAQELGLDVSCKKQTIFEIK